MKAVVIPVTPYTQNGPVMCIFGRQGKVAIVGDVLPRGSVGYSDLRGGDHVALIRTIYEKLWPLGDETTFVPGDEPLSTFGHERQSNPFVSDHLFS